MNERIKQLQFQAAAQIPPLLEASEWQKEFTKKFAELIIKECANVITETRWHLPPTQQQIAVGVKEHFGVDE
jgi:hydrogenase maturation factor HypE